MGDFIIKIHAVGGHGCERKAKAGEVFTGCGRVDCPDCVAQMLVRQFELAMNGTVESATLTHWPVELNATNGRSYDEAHEVVDDIAYRTKEGWGNSTLRKRIKGQFG